MPHARRRALALAPALAVLAAIVLAGCQAAPTPEPTPTSEASTPSASAPSPTPTAAPALRPVEPLGGDCERLFADGAVASALGEAELVSPSEHEDIGVRTAGGILCPYSDDGRLFGVVAAIPSDLADEVTEFAEPACAMMYGGGWECIAARVVGEFWVLASTAAWDGDESDSQAFLASLSDAQDAVGAALDGETAQGVDRTPESLALPVDCDALAAGIDIADLLDATEVFPTRIEEGNGPVERRVADALPASARCDWSELDDFRELGLTVFPDADWAWADLDLGDPEDVEIPGMRAVLSVDRHGAALIAMTDGTNLIELRGRELPRDAFLTAAERVAAALA